MTTGTAGLQLASGKADIFEFVVRLLPDLLGLLPDWLQGPVIALCVLSFVVLAVRRVKRRIARRRARRQGQEPRGADFLGSYAPPQTQRDAPR
ncbi:hypothetical protein [Streptomyces sp. NPDC018693]|uniref:hypothetical protein n=1 Tax=unclassified Streptomyces TaxID=2593676 RepID=UPI00378D2860